MAGRIQATCCRPFLGAPACQEGSGPCLQGTAGIRGVSAVDARRERSGGGGNEGEQQDVSGVYMCVYMRGHVCMCVYISFCMHFMCLLHDMCLHGFYIVRLHATCMCTRHNMYTACLCLHILYMHMSCTCTCACACIASINVPVYMFTHTISHTHYGDPLV